jgi:hypothetical protein
MKVGARGLFVSLGVQMEGLNRSVERGAVEYDGSPRFRIKWEMVIGWVVAAFLAYAAAVSRVAVLESKYETVEQQLREMRADIKELLRRP